MKHSQILAMRAKVEQGDKAAINQTFAYIEDLRILIDELSDRHQDKEMKTRVALAFGHLDPDEDSE